MLEEAFLGAIVTGASQTGEVDKEGDFAGGGLWREKEVEAHFAIGGRGIVGELEELAAERGDCCFCLDRHDFVNRGVFYSNS